MVAELPELSALIGDIYDSAIDPVLWQPTLARICAYVGGFQAALFWHDAATHSAPPVLHLFNEDPAFTRLYFEKYLPIDPLFPVASLMEEGVVNGASDFIPPAQLEQTRFFKEWLEPQGIVDALSVNLEKGATRSAFLNLRTDASYGRADEPMRQRLALLVPHLQRAVAIGRLFSRERSDNQAFSATLDHVEAGVFLVDPKGKITFANKPARAILHVPDLIFVADDVLRAVAPAADALLRETFAAATSGDASIGVRGVALPLTDAAADGWLAHILPLTSGRRIGAGEANGAAAAVFIRRIEPNAPPPLEVIATRYRLSAAETQVLNALVQVRGIRAMAEMLGLSQNTVKSHLANLFRKTGTRRQADLARLVTGR